MPQLHLFDDDLPPAANRLGEILRGLSTQGIHFGTSSWKYPGWLGSIYSPARYSVRGKFSQRKFDQECLEEYAQTFPIVCGDFSFYQFPTSEFWSKLFGSCPATLQFAFKVPEEITVSTWPTHARYGQRAGRANAGFLDARLLNAHFSEPLLRYRHRVSALILEFGAFPRKLFASPSEFAYRLDRFLEQLTPGLPYAVEIRNAEFLNEDYVGTLARHRAAHVFNAWTRMPTLLEQSTMEGAFCGDFVVARALLRHGRAYQDAVELFQPYQVIQQPDASSREGLTSIARQARQLGKPAFLFVNNRLEGFAPGTIEAVASTLI